MPTWFSALVAFAVSLTAMPLVLVGLRAKQVMDQPNERSSHDLPTPRGAGIACLIGALGALVLCEAFRGPLRTGLVVVAVGFAILGLAEDFRGVPPLPRLAAQLGMAGLALVWLLDELQGPLGWRLLFGVGCLLWLAAYANAFNFMDGINGISAAQVVVAGGAWVVIGHLEDVPVLTAGGAIAAAAALAFMPFNFPTAKVFLGDVGSYLFGGWLAAMVIVALRAGIAPEAVLAPLTLYLADTASTLVRRIRAGEVVYLPHRSHAYQRLTELGWSHARTTAFVTAVMVASSALGALALDASVPVRVLGDAALLGLLAAYVASPYLLAKSRQYPSPPSPRCGSSSSPTTSLRRSGLRRPA